jgi:hypothetical protein
LRQVFFKLANVSRQRRPSSLRVPPLILRRLTYSRMSPSLRLCRVPDYAVWNSAGALSPADGTRGRSLLARHSPVVSLVWPHARERETTCPSKVSDRDLQPRMISPFT